MYLRYKTGFVDELLRDFSTRKLFQNVPQADMEMFFSNTLVRMRLLDKLLMGVPAFVGGLIELTNKLSGSILFAAEISTFWLGLSADPVELNKTNLLNLDSEVGALGAYLFRQLAVSKLERFAL